ncbi:MAG: metal ABC transporter permease [Cardiobacteriaceae bacterium]|nr:metal ABC transporter permease [Cardiobacteriaceae bacterium]
MNIITEALQYPFMQQALWVATLIGITCALLSCFLVLKGWALMGDAISHAILPGIVLANSLGLPLITGAFAAGLTCTLATGWFEKRTTLQSDTLLGIVFSTLFAAGLILFQRSNTSQHLTHILFGNLLGMLPSQRWQVLILCLFVLLVLAVKWRDFMLFVFDPVQARLTGMSIPWLHTTLLVMLTLTAIGAMQAVGVVLVVAMLIAPGVSAQLVTRRFSHTLITAVALSVCACCAGVIISFHWDASTGACIVLCQAVGFLLMLLLRSLRTNHNA